MVNEIKKLKKLLNDLEAARKKISDFKREFESKFDPELYQKNKTVKDDWINSWIYDFLGSVGKYFKLVEDDVDLFGSSKVVKGLKKKKEVYLAVIELAREKAESNKIDGKKFKYLINGADNRHSIFELVFSFVNEVEETVKKLIIQRESMPPLPN